MKFAGAKIVVSKPNEIGYGQCDCACEDGSHELEKVVKATFESKDKAKSIVNQEK